VFGNIVDAVLAEIGKVGVFFDGQEEDALGPFPDGNDDRVLYDIVRDEQGI